MSRITLSDVTNLLDYSTSQTAINSNSATIEAAFDRVLFKDGTSPNAMTASLDMNSNQIINLPYPSSSNSPVRLVDIIVSGTGVKTPAGGVTNAVLSKVDGTDYNAYWNAPTGSGNVVLSTSPTVSNLTNTSLLTTGSLHSSDTTDSSSTTSGSVQMSGGLGVAKNVFASGFISTGSNNGLTFTDRVNNHNWTWYASSGVAYLFSSNGGSNRLSIDETNGILTIPSTTASSSTTTGALIVSGGAGIAGNLYVGGGTVQLGTSGAVNVNVGISSVASGQITIAGFSSGSQIWKPSSTASGTATMFAGTDTIVGKATTDTFTNKTFDTAGTGNSFLINGVAVTANNGTGAIVRTTSAALITPDLGVPSAVVLTNATGTASSLTAGHVTTNANLTGVITSVGNATSIASQTGTGTKFVVDTSPTLIAPILGVASATSLTLANGTSNGFILTAASGTNATVTMGSGGNVLFTLGSAVNGFSIRDSNSNPALLYAGSADATNPYIQIVGSGSLSSSYMQILASTASSSSTTGALVVAGGVGIGGSINVNGTLSTPNNIACNVILLNGVNNNANTANIIQRSGASSIFGHGNVLTIVDSGNSTFNSAVFSSSSTGGIGYTTGAGGTVTQATSRTTGVTINKVTGAITLFSQVNTAVSQATAQSFTVTNSTVAATDVIIVNQKSGTDKYEIFVTNVAAGSFQITNYAVAGTTNEAPVFNFSVIKGSST